RTTPCQRAGADGPPEGAVGLVVHGARPRPIDSSTLPPAWRHSSSSLLISGGLLLTVPLAFAPGACGLDSGEQLVGQRVDRLGRDAAWLVGGDRLHAAPGHRGSGPEEAVAIRRYPRRRSIARPSPSPSDSGSPRRPTGSSMPWSATSIRP